MLNLAEYRSRADRLADHLPWAALVGPGIVLNKDGSFQRTLAFRGPDLESATEAELIGACARANNVLKRLGSGWAMFFDAERVAAPGYPASRFPDPASALVDRERRAAFEAEGVHFESRYHLTLQWLPAADAVDSAGRRLVDRPDAGGARDWRGALSGFVAETDRVADLISGFMPEVRALDDSETLTFLHGCISEKRHPVCVPETPVYLDALLVDTPLTGGLEPRAVGLDDEIEALGIGKVPGLLSRLGGIDLDVGQHGRFPSKAGSIRGQQKRQHFVVAAVALSRISPDGVWRFSVKKCCETSRLLDLPGRRQSQ